MYFSVSPPIPKLPCQPNPCGSNARCTPSDNGAVCTCLKGFIGNPYIQCRPECVVSSDCPLTLLCINQKCRDPCPGTCGSSAICIVVSHNPKCLCPQGYIGDPYTDCQPRPIAPRKIIPSYLKELWNLCLVLILWLMVMSGLFFILAHLPLCHELQSLFHFAFVFSLLPQYSVFSH